MLPSIFGISRSVFKVEHEPLDDFARTQLDGGDLDHLVEADVKARGLRVEDDRRSPS